MINSLKIYFLKNHDFFSFLLIIHDFLMYTYKSRKLIVT